MLSIFFIGLALSMDAFSLALGLGTSQISKLQKIILPLLVGIMHFIMPVLGLIISDRLSSIFQINFRFLVIIIFLYLGLVMILENKELNKIIKYSIFNLLTLAFSVSVDSFSVGLSLKAYDIKIFMPSFIFFICSMIITYLGLVIGEYSTKHLKEKAPILGGMIFIILAIVNIIKYFV
ncbi:MAG: hypothetical protein GX265_03030 [Mollicutes bacterium]|nr:hypothetical protein [Mollicutes bacterium]